MICGWGYLLQQIPFKNKWIVAILILKPKSSAHLQWALICGHLLAFLAVIQLPFGVFLISTFFIIGHFGWYWFQQPHTKIKTITYYQENQWVLVLSKQEVEAQLLESTLFLYWLIILHFKTQDNQWVSMVIMPDMLEKQQYKKLCFYLNNFVFAKEKGNNLASK